MKYNNFNKIALSLSIIVLILISAVVFSSSSVDAKNDESQIGMYNKLRLFNEVLFKLREHYVDELSVDELIDAAIDGMLDELDPHTTYFTRDEFDRFTTDTRGEFGGLGISIDKMGEYITVVSPIEGTPAYHMGILAGDRIIKVDGEDVIGISTEDAIKKMRGEKGTKVTITIDRPGVETDLDFEIERDIIKIKSIPYAFKMDNGIGYVRVRQFNQNVSSELRDALDSLENQGIRGLMIDLRFNPGGLLDEAINTVNEFIGRGKRVVFTKGRTPQTDVEYYTRFNRKRDDYPVIVLINEASASASEIFAGSMQDWDRGLVVGKTSFGKGSVQRLFPLESGDGLKITTAKYYINSGRCIHREILDRVLRGERVSQEEWDKAEEDHYNDVYYTNEGRIVYGGGGINPDIELEQSTLTSFAMELRRTNALFSFSIDYILEHDENIPADFEADEQVMDKFFSYIDEKEIEYEQTDIDSTYDWISNSITSNIISRVHGDEAGYKISIRQDSQLQEALELFDRFDTLQEMFAYAQELREEELQARSE